MPRIHDIFFALAWAVVAVGLFFKAHSVWQDGRIGYASFFAAGSLCAITSAITCLTRKIG